MSKSGSRTCKNSVIFTAVALADISLCGSTIAFTQTPDSPAQQRDSTLQQLWDLLLKSQTRTEQLKSCSIRELPIRRFRVTSHPQQTRPRSSQGTGAVPTMVSSAETSAMQNNVITKGLDSE
jgi:hypothetical protein